MQKNIFMTNRIDGRKIAEDMLEDLLRETKEKKLHPHLAVILVGQNPASISFIRQKQRAAEKIGGKVTIHNLEETANDAGAAMLIDKLNADASVHGIIIQRPLPDGSLISQKTLQSVSPQKDVDGFVKSSLFDVPVAKAVINIIEQIFQSNPHEGIDFTQWLRTQTIVVIGKGETAGGPIISTLEKLSAPVVCIDSKTQNIKHILKKATVIISCVGKQMITQDSLRDDVVLISVGIRKGEDGKLHGDYEEDDIAQKALFYTPTPGGVGPVNVACLMENLVKAAQRSRE